MQIPSHLKKFVELYARGKIDAASVTHTPDSGGDVTKDAFEFSIPLYNEYGDVKGAHSFALTIESLVDTKLRETAVVNSLIGEFDAFVETYDALLGILNEIKLAKEKKT